jgi:hypothetical protein
MGNSFFLLSPTPSTKTGQLQGYYEGDALIYIARVRNGFVPALRAKVFERFKGLDA